MKSTYYEQVRDAVERLAECTTSDAQGIIGAWELKNGGTMMGNEAMDRAEQAGTTPENLALQILSKGGHATPLMEEFLNMVEGASALLDMEPDDEHTDPVGDGTDLCREAAEMRPMIERHYAKLVNAIRLAVESGPIANADPNTHAILKAAYQSTK